ncbi:MAG: 8-oxo-dGTP diphosphatase [Provencibacterium sp.]|jgi:8-oxo-dGTP diphosphatase|nr:8-oxo-dGTP diphosphatase [Provencibacterium sp.]
MRNSTLCYIEQDGCYLMLHRTKKEKDINKDKWLGVGGGFEWGESPEDCLLREVREETGLTLTDYRYRGIVTFVNEIPLETEYMHLFTAAGFTGSLADCDEGELEWVEKERISRLPIWPGDLIFLKLLAEEAPFFSLKLEYRGDRLANAVLNGKRLELE